MSFCVISCIKVEVVIFLVRDTLRTLHHGSWCQSVVAVTHPTSDGRTQKYDPIHNTITVFYTRPSPK